MLLNRNNLNIHKFCADEGSTLPNRAATAAVLVTKDETVATDGHILVRVTVPRLADSLFPNLDGVAGADIEGPTLIRADAAKEMADSIPKGEQTLPVLATARICQDGDTVKGIATDLSVQHVIQGREVAGEFPKWQSVIPNKKPSVELWISAKYLSEIIDFSRKLSDSGIIRLQIFGPDQPIRIDAEDAHAGQGMTAVVMPCRAPNLDLQYAYKNGNK